MRFLNFIISLVLAALFVTLFVNLQHGFEEVDTRLVNGTMVNLNEKQPGKLIRTLLEKGYYFEDKKDIALIESVVSSGAKSFAEPIDNIGELNKSRFFVTADEAFVSGGRSFKKRVMDSRALLGYTGDDSLRFRQEKSHPPQLPASADLQKGGYGISGSIVDSLKNPVPGILVKLQMVLPMDSGITDDEEGAQSASLTAYVRTGASGNYSFLHLPDGKAYEVLPLQPGFQFGRTQGIPELDKNVSFTFRQSPHKIRLFSARDFKILKKEKSLIVRSPSEYNKWYWIITGCFFAGFFLLNVLLRYKFPQADQLVLPVVMLMTGLSFVTLLSLQDPLRDRFLARDTLTFFGIGMAGIVLLLLVKFRKLTVDSRFLQDVCPGAQ